MNNDDEIYRLFLEEMDSFEEFRSKYTESFPGTILDQDDADVRRIIEALAFFSARSRETSERQILKSRTNLFRQHFDYLLSPIPMMSFIKADYEANFVDPAFLPKNTGVKLSSKQVLAGDNEKTNSADFLSIKDINLFPIELKTVATMLRPDGKTRLLFEFESAFERSNFPDEIELMFSQLGDFSASLQSLYLLKQNLETTAIFFDKEVSEIDPGRKIQTSISFFDNDPEDSYFNSMHPVEAARLMFHCPEQSLFLKFSIDKAPRNWKKISIALDLSSDWPRKLRFHKRQFHSNVIPLINLRKDSSNPILFDGKKERYYLSHPNIEEKFSLHSIESVYRIDDPDQNPVLPSSIGRHDENYELEQADKISGGIQKSWIRLVLPESFPEEVKLMVEAKWIQPYFIEHLNDDLEVELIERFLEDVNWQKLSWHKNVKFPKIINKSENLIRMLAIKNRKFLELGDITFILEALEIDENHIFHSTIKSIRKLDIISQPHSVKLTSSLKYIYNFKLAIKDDRDWSKALLFFSFLHLVLKTWNHENTINTAIENEDLALKHTFS